ncbi:hypothetical protein [Effusibacillus lacus]|uniref:hypothetical protein n=1 Tax=Effusibacillus lacus TaxID=1348429 RepID=UPI00350E5321
MMNDRTLVPVRFVSEALGARVFSSTFPPGFSPTTPTNLILLSLFPLPLYLKHSADPAMQSGWLWSFLTIQYTARYCQKN